MASIFAQLGFDGLLLGRIDYQDKNFRFKTKTAEVVWEASHNLGTNPSLQNRSIHLTVLLQETLQICLRVSCTIRIHHRRDSVSTFFATMNL